VEKKNQQTQVEKSDQLKEEGLRKRKKTKLDNT
jgi:hypothetical protein